MNHKWEIKALGDLYQIARGGSPRPIKAFLTTASSGINWIKIGDASAGDGKYIEVTEERIRPEGVSRSRKVKAGDFLLSNSMSFGRPYILKTDGCIHDGWLVLSPKSDAVDQDFLYFFLSSNAAYEQFDRMAAGSTVRNLNTELVKKVEMPVPPIAEQKRIVAKLDQALQAIELSERNAEVVVRDSKQAFVINPARNYMKQK